eukprot:TRINITY_DN62552_c0_g1_i1.p1 TRINITY_DN62552_c0_g1~~TRINITY_DN62552_c0_g1_i1.p1  ORF type:complete len:230 (-),score=44.73 TRINITY_DN62552_c0_g1_i1:135-824(-)
MKIADVDWNKHHLGEAEWEEKQRRRYMRRLAQYQGTTLDNAAKPNHPWAPLSSSKADQDVLNPALRRNSSSLEPAHAPSRTGSSWGRAASDAASDAGPPPRTSSTTLTTLWHRALSSPNLKPPVTGASVGSTTSSARERALERIRSSEAWFSACESMPKEELLELVEHVHGKLLDERSKRKQVESELLNKSVTFHGVGLGGSGRTSTGGSRRRRIADRMPTPAVPNLAT